MVPFRKRVWFRVWREKRGTSMDVLYDDLEDFLFTDSTPRDEVNFSLSHSVAAALNFFYFFYI